jgi:hypothetical protein
VTLLNLRKVTGQELLFPVDFLLCISKKIYVACVAGKGSPFFSSASYHNIPTPGKCFFEFQHGHAIAGGKSEKFFRFFRRGRKILPYPHLSKGD